MIKKILYKIFKLEDEPCQTCEVLRIELARERDEKQFLLSKLLEPKSETQPVISQDRNEPQSIRSTFVPWRVRREALEAESRAKARIMDKFKTENPTITTGDDTAELEKEIIGEGNAG